MTSTKPPTVFMYSGQGSQYFHMARELYEQDARFRAWMDHCEELAAPVLGKSLLATVFDPAASRATPFDTLADSNAALLCVEYSLTRVVEEQGCRADALLGYSLGELAAAIAAEVFPLEDGLAVAVELARLLEARTPRAGMLAVLGPTTLLRTHPALFARCWVTGHNFDGNFVVSGLAADIAALQEALEREAILCQRLPVNYGVHTALIDGVEAECRRAIGALRFARPRIPIVSSVSGDVLPEVSVDSVWAAIREPIQFSRAIASVVARGDAVFVDLGPSATLATFVKYLLPAASGSRQLATLNRFGNDVKAITAFREQWARA